MRTILLWAAMLSLVPTAALAQGVDAKRLSAKGWGDTKPVGDNRTEDGRAQSRRVEPVKK